MYYYDFYDKKDEYEELVRKLKREGQELDWSGV